MRKIYLDRTESKACTGVFVRNAEVTPAGSTVYSMSVKDKNEEYQRYADEYDVRFIFDDDVPKVDFYTVPWIDLFARDSKGGFWGTIGAITDFNENAPICYIDSDHRCFLAADSGQEFLKGLKENKIELKRDESVVFYKSREDAEKELEFIKLNHRPQMILFDYGQTLINERQFDGVKGTAEVMKYAVCNKYHRTPEQVQAEADRINDELGRFDPAKRHLFQVEVHNNPFNAYLYESQGIKLSLLYDQIEKIFWDAAAPGIPTDGIEDFLQFLKAQGIRTGVISNISFSGKVLKERIDRLLPDNEFEFIIASSEYVFRKPNRRIFELALEKAGLKADQVWYIGDQYECDIVGAEEAGLFPVWYTAYAKQKQDMRMNVLKCESWKDLQRLIEGL